MKKKDILTIIVAVALIGVSGYFLYKMLAPAKTNTASNAEVRKTEVTITGDIDQDTLKLITEKKDYGQAALDNIGRTNPFGPLN